MMVFLRHYLCIMMSHGRRWQKIERGAVLFSFSLFLYSHLLEIGMLYNFWLFLLAEITKDWEKSCFVFFFPFSILTLYWNWLRCIRQNTSLNGSGTQYSHLVLCIFQYGMQLKLKGDAFLFEHNRPHLTIFWFHEKIILCLLKHRYRYDRLLWTSSKIEVDFFTHFNELFKNYL